MHWFFIDFRLLTLGPVSGSRTGILKDREKMLPRCCRGVAAGVRCGECTGSITSMIYYSQGTGCSLSSQYSLQESISKNIFGAAKFTIGALCEL